MNDLITQIGVGGIFAVMMLREVLAFLGKRSGEPSIHDLLKDIKADTHVLIKWHEPVDGEQSWKNPRMQEVLETLSKSVEQNSKILDKICDVLERMEK